MGLLVNWLIINSTAFEACWRQRLRVLTHKTSASELWRRIWNSCTLQRSLFRRKHTVECVAVILRRGLLRSKFVLCMCVCGICENRNLGKMLCVEDSVVVNMSIILALIAAFGASVDGTRYGAASMASYGTARVTSRKSLSLRHRKSDAVGRCWNVKGIGSAYIHYHSDISLFTSYFLAEA